MTSDYFLEKSLKSLALKSKYPLGQIRQKYKIFMSKHPSGVVLRNEIIEMFSKILPETYSEHYCDKVLQLFGNEETHEIDFENVVMAQKTIEKWTNEEKLTWLFNLLDRFCFRLLLFFVNEQIVPY